MSNLEYVWKDRKRTIFGLPWSFTKYRLTKEKLLIETGVLSQQEEEVRLYRIMDVTLKRSLGERLFGLGTIHCSSADVKNMLSDMIEAERMEKRIAGREFMGDDGDFDGDLHE